jgi:hypothetical protein
LALQGCRADKGGAEGGTVAARQTVATGAAVQTVSRSAGGGGGNAMQARRLGSSRISTCYPAAGSGHAEVRSSRSGPTVSLAAAPASAAGGVGGNDAHCVVHTLRGVIRFHGKIGGVEEKLPSDASSCNRVYINDMNKGQDAFIYWKLYKMEHIETKVCL